MIKYLTDDELLRYENAINILEHPAPPKDVLLSMIEELKKSRGITWGLDT